MLDSMLQRLPARFAISTVLCTMVAAAFAEGLHGTEEFVADVLGRMKRGQDVDRATLDHVVDICESALDSAPEDTRAYPLFLKAARGLIDYSPDDIEGRLGVYYAQSELVKKILGRQYIIHGMSGQDVLRANALLKDFMANIVSRIIPDYKPRPFILWRKRGQTPMTRVVEVEISGNVSIAERRVAP